MNFAILTGRLTRDIYKPHNTKAPYKFVLAVPQIADFVDENSNTSYVPCQIWGNMGYEFWKKYKKGDPVIVSGWIYSRWLDYEENGQKKGRFTFAVNVQKVENPMQKKQDRPNTFDDLEEEKQIAVDYGKPLSKKYYKEIENLFDEGYAEEG